MIMITTKMPATTMTMTTVDKAVETAVEGSSGRGVVIVEKDNGRDRYHRHRLPLPEIRITITVGDQVIGKEEGPIVSLEEVGVEVVLVWNTSTIAKYITIGEIKCMIHD